MHMPIYEWVGDLIRLCIQSDMLCLGNANDRYDVSMTIHDTTICGTVDIAETTHMHVSNMTFVQVHLQGCKDACMHAANAHTQFVSYPLQFCTFAPLLVWLRDGCYSFAVTHLRAPNNDHAMNKLHSRNCLAVDDGLSTDAMRDRSMHATKTATVRSSMRTKQYMN
jgi:hypothetical protein